MSRHPVPATDEAKPPRNKGGRPHKAPEEINSETFLLYMTTAETERLRAMHEQETKLRKVSLNQFIKDRLFNGKNTPSKPDPKRSVGASEEEYNKTLTTLMRIDLNLSRFIGNFNQSTKRLNSIMITSNLKAEVLKHAELLNEMNAIKPDIKSIIDRLKLYFS